MKYQTLPLPTKLNKQTREYAEAVEKGRYSQFVVPTKQGWLVKNHAVDQKLPNFSSKVEAVAAAQDLAAKHNAEVFVFDDKGRITERFVAHR